MTTVLLNNRKYAILQNEYRAVEAEPRPTAMRMLDLGDPDLRWVDLVRGMGWKRPEPRRWNNALT